MKTLMKIWVIFMLIIPMHVWAEAIDVQLPEQEVFKVYDKCLIEQGKLWEKVLENLPSPNEPWNRLQETATFYRGFVPIVNAESVGSVELNFAVENGQLGMRIEDKDRKWDYYEPKKIVGLQTVYLSFFKFYTEKITHEIVNHLGERTEHEVRVARHLNLNPPISNAPAVFTNANTGLPILDHAGNPIQLDRAQFADCLRKQVTQSSLDYAITSLGHLNKERADYIKRVSQESGDIGIVFRGQSFPSRNAPPSCMNF